MDLKGKLLCRVFIVVGLLINDGGFVFFLFFKCRFGVPEHDNNGWIICESKSEGKRPYYFNVFTRCTTWQLPIPKGIDLPSYNFTQVR